MRALWDRLRGFLRAPLNAQAFPGLALGNHRAEGIPSQEPSHGVEGSGLYYPLVARYCRHG
jgi:hypothetical protein